MKGTWKSVLDSPHKQNTTDAREGRMILGGLFNRNYSLYVRVSDLEYQKVKQWGWKRCFLSWTLVKACQKLKTSFDVAHIYLSIS